MLRELPGDWSKQACCLHKSRGRVVPAAGTAKAAQAGAWRKNCVTSLDNSPKMGKGAAPSSDLKHGGPRLPIQQFQNRRRQGQAPAREVHVRNQTGSE